LEALLNLQVLPIFLLFVAPSVVASTVFSFFFPTEGGRKLADYLIELITFSMFYLTLFFWLIVWFASQFVLNGQVMGQ